MVFPATHVGIFLQEYANCPTRKKRVCPTDFIIRNQYNKYRGVNYLKETI